MIKISHEVPLVLLETSRRFNDYDYALVHLFEKNEEYFNFYKESLAMGREVLLDNSIFELGTAFDAKLFAYWIEKLKPTKYIIPDVWGDSKGTIKNIFNWRTRYDLLPGKKIGCVQGSTYEELDKCYEVAANYCDEIAICFHYSCYGDTLQDKMKGRQQLIKKWMKDGRIRRHMPHHLLGCSLPQEFSFYKDYPFITSLDTSNPIIHGMEFIRYDETGLEAKSKSLLAEFLNASLSAAQISAISYNIHSFKKIVG